MLFGNWTPEAYAALGTGILIGAGVLAVLVVIAFVVVMWPSN